MEFGAFVNFFGKKDGLVHVSQISTERVAHPKLVSATHLTTRLPMCSNTSFTGQATC